MNSYLDFLQTKADESLPLRSIPNPSISDVLFPFQQDCARHLLGIGRAAAFLDTGLGKTIIQCEWARHIPGEVLIIAPLAVGHQTIEEAKKLLGMKLAHSSDGQVKERITVTNYERVHHFDCSRFTGVVLDESSILKGQSSKTKAMLCDLFSETEFRLACTATPAPNDYTEIGNHAEFLGIMNTQEMLMRWFLHDSANTGDWRLKGHAVKSFWEWVASWAACISSPADLGYDASDYELPPLHIETITVEGNTEPVLEDGVLFDVRTTNATSLHSAKRETVHDRVKVVADRVNASSDPWIVWCESNEESELLTKSIPDAVEVKGSHTPEAKEKKLLQFTHGEARVIVSKPSICGFGLNWQHCRNIAFASISYSYEKFYQAVRRSWRFGQTKEVNVLVVLADSEIPVWRAVERKATAHSKMKAEMRNAVFKTGKSSGVKLNYQPVARPTIPDWLLANAG